MTKIEDGVLYISDVSEIKDGEFEGGCSFEEVIISEDVKCIGTCAFRNCQNIIKVKIEGEDINICEFAFEDCDNLDEIDVYKINSIEYGAFQCCGKFINHVGGYLGNILLEEKHFNYFCDEEFDRCQNNGLSEDGTVFNRYIKDTEPYIPSSVKEIGSRAFSESDIQSINIPDTVTVIDDSAFKRCKNLKNVIIPDSVRVIGNGSFCDTGLENVIIAEGVEEIKSFAFYDCKSLKNIIIPESVKTIGEKAFDNCPNLSREARRAILRINRDAAYKFVKTEEGIITLSYDGKTLIRYGGNDTSVTIPEGVTVIRHWAFRHCENLKTVIIPEGAEIESQAFYYCPNLDSETKEKIIAVNPNGVNKVIKTEEGIMTLSYDGKTLIKYRGRDTEITIPEGVTVIEPRAFFLCRSLERVNIPEGINIKMRAFADCPNLDSETKEKISAVNPKALYEMRHLHIL